MSKSNQQQANRSLPFKMAFDTASFIVGLFGWVLLAFIISVFIEWLGMIFGWWPVDHARSMLNNEIQYLAGIQTTVYGVPATSIALYMVGEVQSWGVDSLLVWAQGLTQVLLTAIASAVNILLLFAVRIAIILCAIPAIILIGIVAFIDGLVEREIRRSCGGVETSWVYHMFKPWITPSLIASAAIYLTLPISINPVYVFAPAAVLMAISIYVAASKFKLFA